MASLHEILTIRRTFRETRPASQPYPVTGHRHPRGAFMPVSACAGVLFAVALVIALGIALRG